ncbi:TRAP transporter small permease [Sulfitobacter sp. LCG007]
MQRMMVFLARATAILGGLVLMALVILTTLSIVGRSLNKLLHSDTMQGLLGGAAQTLIDSGVGEIRGSYELLEAGIALAIFSFFPVCQFYGGHATVDVFTSFLSPRANRVIAAFWEIVLAAVLILLSARLYEGMMRYVGNGETTLFLQFPIWWSYAASFAASVVTCIVALYCAAMRVAEALGGRPILPSN